VPAKAGIQGSAARAADKWVPAAAGTTSEFAMEWRDTGFVLSTRRHGESALIVELLTAEHGRHAGLVRGGQSPRRRGLLQPGNLVAANWRGRLPEHLGSFECELVHAHAAPLLDDPDRLAALSAAAALLLAALPEREPHGDLYAAFAALLAALDSPGGWAEAYVIWECGLLAALGFGLDLGRCAATGSNQDLAYVSPRSGRAVSREAGRPYHDKLLPLPGFLWHAAPAAAADIVAGLSLTGYFLLHHLLAPHDGRMPVARDRLLERMRRYAAPGIIDP
jgi:DNA repair protein RecO (recombination protein O)